MANKEVAQILRKARKQGLEVVGKDGQQHWLVRHPDTKREVRVPASPGRGRSLENVIAQMRRELGFVWKGRGSTAPPRKNLWDREDEV